MTELQKDGIYTAALEDECIKNERGTIYMGLTPGEMTFVDILVGHGGAAKTTQKAAVMAGYKGKGAGSLLMRKAKVRAAVEKMLELIHAKRDELLANRLAMSVVIIDEELMKFIRSTNLNDLKLKAMEMGYKRLGYMNAEGGFMIGQVQDQNGNQSLFRAQWMSKTLNAPNQVGG